MIDDYNKAMELLHKIEAQLPIPARLTEAYAQAVQDSKLKALLGQELQIQRVLYMGDAGGIACDVKPAHWQGSKEVLLVSLTQLRVSLHHPLAQEILAYQLERIRRIKQSAGLGKPTAFSIRQPKKQRRK